MRSERLAPAWAGILSLSLICSVLDSVKRQRKEIFGGWSRIGKNTYCTDEAQQKIAKYEEKLFDIYHEMTKELGKISTTIARRPGKTQDMQAGNIDVLNDWAVAITETVNLQISDALEGRKPPENYQEAYQNALNDYRAAMVEHRLSREAAYERLSVKAA